MKQQSLEPFSTTCANTKELILVRQSGPSSVQLHYLLLSVLMSLESCNYIGFIQYKQVWYQIFQVLNLNACGKHLPKNLTQAVGWLEKMENISSCAKQHFTTENGNLPPKVEVLAGQQTSVLNWTKYFWENIYIPILVC